MIDGIVEIILAAVHPVFTTCGIGGGALQTTRKAPGRGTGRTYDWEDTPARPCILEHVGNIGHYVEIALQF